MLGRTRRSGTSTFYLLLHMEGWAGRKKPTMATALWLKPRWGNTKPLLVLVCGRAASLDSRAKRQAAGPSSIECWTQDAQTPSAVSRLRRNPARKRGSSIFALSMQQRHERYKKSSNGLSGRPEDSPASGRVEYLRW